MAGNEFTVTGRLPRGERIEVRLKRKRSNLGAWWLDEEGTVGHNCLHEFDCNAFPAWFSKVARGFDPVQGTFRAYCLSCGVDVPQQVFIFADLRRLGSQLTEVMEP